MDLEDLLEDLVEDSYAQARRSVERSVAAARRRSRMPGARARLRTAALWSSVAWGGGLGAVAVGLSTIGAGFNGWDVAAIATGLAALPAVPAGVWAVRTRTRDRAQRIHAAASRTAREELAQMPPDVAGDWKRLRRAQALVDDLAGEGLVDAAAVAELSSTAQQLHVLLVADERAAQLGGSPSAALRTRVADLADLLVALAVEAVEHRTAEVGAATAPATLREATDRLRSLRMAREEVEGVDARAAGTVDPADLRRGGAAPRDERDGRDDQRGAPATG